ncbi:MAG: SDR family NAD(P)-dependent oxidoreductase [Erysipelotrichaceae bacterium]|uniref:SDR family NAD(P)-dependent oxidoreductase n=1 Tax=Floccifex sp. TaxID=2815810 RepID=UPI0029FEFB1C|nr:SDR family NAD(P)-dependent oxidoreductase [Floccifex sp.]MDD7281885.1 SDR family NAD(P)-dependent oxidoreductase [Erysipelotrichaceae bacterium]MDY2958604.1 SDR family NAD(P)-dependent oxidoreductase [Floccifex sp.]
MNIAIVTGASSGLGKEFINQLLDYETNLDEIWVIARRMNRLEEIECPVPIRPFSIDLTNSNQINDFEQYLNNKKPNIKCLINAAGFGKIGDYSVISRNEIDKMIDLNCKGAVDMTLICLPFMNSGSHILEICSTSGFQPFPYLNVYAATKSFLYRYSRALRVELKPRNISVTAVCPYWIKDTEFINIANESNQSAIHSFIFASKTKKVVTKALFDSYHNFAVSTPGIICTLHRIICKIIPSSILMKGWNIIRKL